MITITSQPLSIPRDEIGGSFDKQPPVPMSDCLRWTLQADASDAIVTPGAKASITVVIPFTCTVPADGTPLKIWGYDFEVNGTEDFTSSSFKVDTIGLITVLNFANMLSANLFFNRALYGGIFSIVGSTYEITFEWIECREQPRFAVEHMDFTALTALGGSGSFANGVSPVYVEGFKIVTRAGFFQDATSEFLPISKLVGIEADKLCDEVGEVSVDYRRDIELGLFTHFPDLTSTSFISSIENGRSLMRLLALEYGWVYRENCQGQSGTIKKSDIVLGINAAFDVDDPYQMRRYWHNHPEGFPPGQFLPDFLTTQPKSMKLCWNSFAWLWFLNNRQQEFGQYRVVARFNVFNASFQEQFLVTVNNPLTMGSSFYQPVNFNISPQFVLDNTPTLTAANIVGYEVKVDIYETLTNDIIDNGSEILTFYPGHCCDETTDLYFLTPPGGWTTQIIDIEERNMVRDGQEINIQVSCAEDRIAKARQGGRTLVSLRTYERISFVIYALNDDENRRWLKHLTQSPQHKIKVPGERVFSVYPASDVAPIAKKFLLDLDSVKISVTGQGIEYRATGYLADIPTQKGVEP